jgi:hypothetical protein
MEGQRGPRRAAARRAVPHRRQLRKFVASATAKNPVDPFIDPEGYRDFIDDAEAEFRRGVVH